MTIKNPMTVTANSKFPIGQMQGSRSFFENKDLAPATLVHGVNGHVAFHSVKMRASSCWPGLLMLLIVAAGCTRDRTGTSEFDSIGKNGQSTGVAVTTPALFYLASEIASESVNVFLVGRSEEEETAWSPDAIAISKLQKADLIIQNGAGYESWLQNITVPQEILVDAAAINGLELVPLADSQTHQHGPTGQQSKTVYASQVWHDPSILRNQAILVRDQLIETFPLHADAFRGGCERVNETLDELIESIEKVTRAKPTGPMFDPSNSFAYLIRAFHSESLTLTQDILLIDTTSSTEAELKALNELAAMKPVVLLPMGKTYDSLQVKLEQNHTTVVRLDTLGIMSNEQAFIFRLRDNIARLIKAISAHSP